jgi:hypothetical protein
VRRTLHPVAPNTFARPRCNKASTRSNKAEASTISSKTSMASSKTSMTSNKASDGQQGIYDQQQGIYAKQQDIDNKVGVIMVNLIPSLSLLPSNPKQESADLALLDRLHHTANAGHTLWEQTGVSEGNEEGGPQGYRPVACKRREPACLLAQRSGWDRKINHRPIVRRDNLREWKAWGQFLLFAGFRGPQQSSKDLPNPRLPTRLPISTFPTKVARGFEGAP